jgi:hypothetical protein
MALINKLKAIANAIRSKTNKNEELTLEQMASEVSGISTLQGLDFSEIYDAEQANELNQFYKDGIEYGEYIKNNWNNNILKSLEGNSQLVYMPEVEYPQNPIKNYFFLGCVNLEYVEGEYITLPRPLGAFAYCGALRRIPIFDARLYNNASCASVFAYCIALQDVTIINSLLITNLASAFVLCRNIRNISIDDVSNCVNFNGTFNSCLALVNLRIGKWKQASINISSSNLLSSESIKYIIWHALNGANTLGFENQGATSRTLTLQKAITHDVTWAGIKDTTPSVADCEMLGIDESEITKYGNLTWSQIASEVKLITITA